MQYLVFDFRIFPIFISVNILYLTFRNFIGKCIVKIASEIL